ncbi:MAG TPA: hypothetical protein DIW23_08025 [Anaerolineae bacterium]|nr:hypothetical protein [Anaerolineae bacterium]
MKNILLILLPLIALLSIFLYRDATLALGSIVLFLSLTIATYNIFQKYKESDNPRLKIVKDMFVLVFTIILISFLGGLAGLFVNFYVGNMFGAMAGFVCAMLAGIAVGYLVRKGISKVAG